MHEFTDMTENWKENVAPGAPRRPLRELQLQAPGEISLETESLKRKSRWAADIEFRLTLFEQEPADQWDDAQVDVTSDEAPETRLERLETPEKQDISEVVPPVSVPWTWDLEVPVVPPSFPHDQLDQRSKLQGGHFHDLHTTLEPDGPDGDANGGISDEWPTPPDSPLPGLPKLAKESPMEDPGDGDHGDHDDYGSPEVFSFAKSKDGAMEAIETSPICSPIEVIEAGVRSEESVDHRDHFDVDTIDTCLDTTFDSEAQSLLMMMCSQVTKKQRLKDSPVLPERFGACDKVKPWKPSVKLSASVKQPVKEVKQVLVPSAGASPESYAMSTSASTSSASRLRSRTLEPLPSWNFDTLRGYFNTFQRSKMRQQQRQQRLQQLNEAEIRSLRTPRTVRSDRSPSPSPRSIVERQQVTQATRVTLDRERSADRATCHVCVTSRPSRPSRSSRSASLSVPSVGAPGPMQVHCRGELWMEHRKKRQYLRREEARKEELKECTFKPQLSSTSSTPRSTPCGRVLSSSFSCPKISQLTPRHEHHEHQHERHVELYDRQMQWRQRLDEKWDEARQRKQLAELQQLQQMQLARPARPLAPVAPLQLAQLGQLHQLRSPRTPQEVDDAFERFHQRSRQWQQTCQAKQAKCQAKALRVAQKAQKASAQKSTELTELEKSEKLQCRQRSYTKDVTKAGKRRASRDAKELKTCRARSEEPKCRDTPRSKAERHEVHRHLQTLRRALFDSKQDGASPRWQKALQVEVARSEGAGAAPTIQR
eukprot:s103_g77.t1